MDITFTGQVSRTPRGSVPILAPPNVFSSCCCCCCYYCCYCCYVTLLIHASLPVSLSVPLSVSIFTRVSDFVCLSLFLSPRASRFNLLSAPVFFGQSFETTNTSLKATAGLNIPLVDYVDISGWGAKKERRSSYTSCSSNSSVPSVRVVAFGGSYLTLYEDSLRKLTSTEG